MKKIIIGVVAATAVGAAAACSANVGTTAATRGTVSQSKVVETGTTTDGIQQGMGASFRQPTAYSFRTVDDQADATFNQLLGINQNGTIAGYFGSGAQGHPNKGYQVGGHASTFVNENFPGSVQTQVTAINDRGVTVGFWSAMNNANQVNDNTGFYDDNGSFKKVAFPTADNANPPVNQLLGVNDSDVAVGFYTDAAGNNHAYRYSIHRNTFSPVKISGSTSATAAAINNYGAIAGFFTGESGTTDGFLLRPGGRLTVLAYPGASTTQALGVNDHDEVVGQYQVGTGNTAQTHGFTWTARGSFKTVDDPNGVGTTTVNGVNNADALVGFYTDGAGNTHGMLATPSHVTPVVRRLNLSPMPTGTVALGRGGDGMLAAKVDVTGLTPGSSHAAEIDAPGRVGPVVRFGTLTADSTGRANATIAAVDAISALPPGSRFVIRLGTSGGDFNRNLVAQEPIAQSEQLGAQPAFAPLPLKALDVNTSGISQGSLAGTAVVTYNPSAQSLTVRLNASGLTPGAHAAHIHSGSCQSQGPVLQMLMDFQADSQGRVIDQTRTVTGVTSLRADGTWYLNLHLGDSNSILSGGLPTLSFRPLLCGNG